LGYSVEVEYEVHFVLVTVVGKDVNDVGIVIVAVRVVAARQTSDKRMANTVWRD
jgi:hypothetical protein